MPLVTCYHLMVQIFPLQHGADDAGGLEYAGNVALAPFQYLFVGETAFVQKGDGLTYEFKQSFDYHDNLGVKTAASITALPFSVVIGSALKAASYLSPEVRERHQRLCEARKSMQVFSHLQEYSALGLEVNNSTKKSAPPQLCQAPRG